MLKIRALVSEVNYFCICCILLELQMNIGVAKNKLKYLKVIIRWK